MSSYVEYLRALRALRIVAVVLGLLLLAALLARLTWGNFFNGGENYVYALEHSRTAHVTRSALPNGMTRTVIDDPKNAIHAVVERRGKEIVSFKVTEPPPERGRARNRETIHDMRAGAPSRTEVSGTTTTGTTTATTTSMTTSGVAYSFFDVGSLFSMTIPLGLLAATLLAGPLSKENNGHLELAWTKPVSRERYALSAVLVDLTAIAVAVVAAAVTLLLASLFWQVPKISFESLAPARIAFALLAPMAWYACLTAFSASLKRGPGAVLGIGWVVAIVCPSIAAMTHDSSTPVGRSVYAVFTTVSYADPITYMWFRPDGIGSDALRATMIGLFALAALAIVYLGLAVVQWRRVEA